MSFLNPPAVPKFRHALLAVLVSAGLASASSAGTAQRLEAVSGAMSGLPASAPGGFANRCGQVLLAAAPSAAQPSADMALWSAKDGGKAWTESKVRVSPWAANAAWDQRVIVAGGISEGKPTAKVLVVESDPDGVLKASELPPLPRPLAGAGAVVMDGSLYVFGGMSSAGPVVFEKTLWKLNLADGGSRAWSEAAAFPGEPGAFFSVTNQYGMMCVFGGLRKSGEGFLTSGESWIYRPKPIEGTSFTGWKRAGDLPAPAAAAAVVPLGQAGVLVAGGVRTPQVASVPPAVPEGAANAWLYHTITDAWCPFDKDLPASGPLVAGSAQDVWLIGRGASWKISFPRSVRNLALIDYIVVIGYFAVLAGIGFFFSRQESSAEFSLGNRKVKWWAAGISMFATGASAISFMAIPALAFATNLVWTLPVVTMLVPAYFLTAYFIFPLLRRMEITSTYEYLERRFNNPLRLIASAQCIIIQTIGRTAVVLVLPALAIASVTGMNVFWSVLLMGILTTIYTSVGGFESVIWTEVFQGVLKFIAPLAMVIVAVCSLPGGFGEFWATSGKYGKLECAVLTWDMTVPALWILLISYLLQFTVMKAGDQPIIQRVFSAPLHEVRRVTAMEAACGILIGLLSNVLGIAIFSYFRAHPDQFSPTAQNDQVVPIFVTQAMPPGFAGMVIAAIFASAMATVASAMNSVATIYTEDFYPRFRPDATDKQRLRTLKTTSYVVGIIGTCMALLLASTNPKSLMVVWAQIVSLMGGGVVGVYSLGMFTRRVNGFGAVCGAVCSIAITLLVKLNTPLHWSSYMPIAILSCMATGWLFSLFSPQTKNLDGLTVFTVKKPAAPEK